MIKIFIATLLAFSNIAFAAEVIPVQRTGSGTFKVATPFQSITCDAIQNGVPSGKLVFRMNPLSVLWKMEKSLVIFESSQVPGLAKCQGAVTIDGDAVALKLFCNDSVGNRSYIRQLDLKLNENATGYFMNYYGNGSSTRWNLTGCD